MSIQEETHFISSISFENYDNYHQVIGNHIEFEKIKRDKQDIATGCKIQFKEDAYKKRRREEANDEYAAYETKMKVDEELKSGNTTYTQPVEDA